MKSVDWDFYFFLIWIHFFECNVWCYDWWK